MKISNILISILIAFNFYSSGLAKLDTEWYKHTIIYEIITTSYKDSDGDGVGDFKGLTSKLDHLDDLGIKCIHLTPPYKSPLKDMGYDISDYYDVDPRYGTMEDFVELIREMKKRGMKMILDLVINHSSDENEWFKKSVDRIDPYTDYYVWKDPRGYDIATGKPLPPNNWRKFFNNEDGSAWEWNEKRKQFYFHQFLPQQCDLNLRNPALKEELKKMIKFWLDKGVAGFRLDAVRSFMEDENFRDNDWFNYRQIDDEGNIQFVMEFREWLDQYSKRQGDFERIFLPEVHADMERVISFYDTENVHIAQMPYTYYLSYFRGEFNARDLDRTLTDWFERVPKNAPSAWVTEDHDRSRIGNRARPEYADILLMISMLLPGTVVTYYGQEIAMLNGLVAKDQMRDLLGAGGRDPNRLPMQWDDSINAGFSTNIKTFLPLNTDYFHRNVKKQKNEEKSHYNLFKTLSKCRENDVLKYGDFKSYVPSDYTYIFTRSYRGAIFIVIVNLGIKPIEIKLNEVIAILPDNISVAATSVNAIYPEGYQLGLSFKMSPLSCIVLEGSNFRSV